MFAVFHEGNRWLFATRWQAEQFVKGELLFCQGDTITKTKPLIGAEIVEVGQ